MSDKNKSENKEKPKMSPEEKEQLYKDITVKTILGIYVTGLFVTIVGVIWAIKDAFTTGAWEAFQDLAIQTKLFVMGLVLVIGFFLVLFLVVLYKRGKTSLAEKLFKEIPELDKKDKEEYMLAKFITVGGLLSFFLIFLGFVINIISLIFSNNDDEGFFSFMANWPGGPRILIAGILILFMNALLYALIYIWQNGYHIIVNKILKYNKKVKGNQYFEQNEQLIGKIVFLTIVGILIGMVLGVLWIIIDMISSDFGTYFRGDLAFGSQISIIGIIATFIFIALIVTMFFYKSGNKFIMTALFEQYKPKDMDEENSSAKWLAGGILVAVTLIIISLLIWFISAMVTAIAASGETIFTILAAQTNGAALFAYCLTVEIFILLGLLFSFFLHNGYAFTYVRLIKAEKLLDDTLTKVETKKKEKKEKKVKDKKE